MEAAVATYSAGYHRHWGAELVLQGARLRFSRAYLAFPLPRPVLPDRQDLRDLVYPTDSAQYAAEAAPILEEARRLARIGTSLFAACSVSVLSCPALGSLQLGVLLNKDLYCY